MLPAVLDVRNVTVYGQLCVWVSCLFVGRGALDLSTWGFMLKVLQVRMQATSTSTPSVPGEELIQMAKDCVGGGFGPIDEEKAAKISEDFVFRGPCACRLAPAATQHC